MKRTLFGIAAVLTCASAMAQNISGAIFTTTVDGETTNGNRIYDTKEEVYLNGGPQNMQGNRGLDDGCYYFMVTDPSGKQLLSTDNIADRALEVMNGRVAGVGNCGGTHANGNYNEANESTPVQLMPFLDTPNNGGVYKAWLTKVEDYDEDNPHSYFGFVHSRSKTDNFMIRMQDPPPPPASTISFLKFYDTDANGEFDPLVDVPIPGFKLVISYTDENGNSFTDAEFLTDGSGLVSIDVMAETPFFAFEVLPLSTNTTWYQSYPNATSGADNQVALLGGGYGYEGDTPEDGYEFEGMFGNYAVLDAAGGNTIGFWSNKNGKTAFDANGGLGVVNGLPLVNEAGNYMADFGGHAAFRTWLLSANANNMAYMLSAQLCGTMLNVAANFIDGDTTYFVPDSAMAGSVNINEWLGDLGLGSAVVGGRTYTLAELFAAAIASLENHPLTVNASDDRTTQECLKNIFDGINNNGGSVLPGLGTIAAPIPVFWYL